MHDNFHHQARILYPGEAGGGGGSTEAHTAVKTERAQDSLMKAETGASGFWKPCDTPLALAARARPARPHHRSSLSLSGATTYELARGRPRRHSPLLRPPPNAFTAGARGKCKEAAL